MSELIVLEGQSPVEIFINNGLDKIIDKIEADVKSIATDPTTKKGRDEIASLAYKVARSKTTLDDMGKALTEDWKKKSAAVDAERKRMRDRMDKIKDEVRKPLTDFENAETLRVETLKNRLQQIRDLLVHPSDATQDDLKELLSKAQSVDLSDWQEFTDMATAAKNEAVDFLSNELIKRIKYDQDQAELARLREEAEKREQQDREAQVAADAAEKVRIQADEERQRLLDEKEAAEREAQRANQERIDAEKRADEAVQREQDRQAELKRQQDAETAAREADKEHRGKINRDIVAALLLVEMPSRVTPEQVKLIITAIAKGEIPNIKIIY